MGFRASVSYLAGGQITVPLPMMVDLSGNNPQQCYFTHARLVPGAATSVAAIFDSRPSVTYNTTGSGSIIAIPIGAKTLMVTPTGGTAAVELGSDRG